MLDSSSFVGTVSFPFTVSILYPDGDIRVPADTRVGDSEIVKDGSEVWMETDLRSKEGKKRTLHFFVDGRQQKIFLSDLPPSIQFGVCILFIFYFSIIIILILVIYCIY